MSAGPTVFDTVDSLLGAAGTDLGASGWRTIDVEQVRLFAEATGAGPTAEDVPPLMLLSLTNCFLPELMDVPGAASGVNYGTGSVRFGAPVHPGDRVRAAAALTDAVEVAGGVQTQVEVRLEVAGSPEPACVVHALSRWLR